MFNWFSVLAYPQKIAIGVALLCITHGIVYFLGWRGAHDSLVQYRQEVKDAAANQEQQTKQKELEYEQTKLEIKNEYEKRLTDNTAYWVKRLRQQSNDSSPVSTSSTTTSGVNADPTNTLPDYSKLILDCQATTIQLESLQYWVSQVSK